MKSVFSNLERQPSAQSKTGLRDHFGRSPKIVLGVENVHNFRVLNGGIQCIQFSTMAGTSHFILKSVKSKENQYK